MTPEDQLLFVCARQKFTPAHAAALRELCRRPVRWARVLACAREHGVAALVYTNLRQTALEPALPSEVAVGFNQTVWEQIFIKTKTAGVMVQLAEQFAREDLLLVKSAALERSVYAQPWYVWSFDVDLLFRRRRDQFDDHEYAEVVTFLDKADRSLRPMDQHLEYGFGEHHDLSMNGMLPIDYERVWQRATPIALGKGAALIPSPEDALLFASVNACRKRYFYLKVLCDSAEIIDAFPALDWPGFAQRARAWRCNLIAYAALRLAQRTLGAPVPASVFAQLEVGAPRRRLIDALIDTLTRLGSLAALSKERGAEAFTRRLGWSLTLTYATYHWDQWAPKLRQIRSAPRS